MSWVADEVHPDAATRAVWENLSAGQGQVYGCLADMTPVTVA
jgi:hypothetical protein